MTRTARLVGALATVAVLGLTACGEQDGSAVPAGGADVSAAGERDADSAGPEDATTSTGAAPAGAAVRVVRLSRGDAEPTLVCPTDERSTMIADFAHGAPGAATPEEAVGPPGLVEAGEQLVVSVRGTTAWVVRPDGSARMEIDLLRHDGWLLHRRTSCG